MVKMLRFVSLIAVVVPFAAPTFGQTFMVKDQNGSVVLAISTVKMFRTSDQDDLPLFQSVVKNVSGYGLTLDTLKGTVHKKAGSTVEFTFGLCDVRWCDFPKDSVRDVSHLFPKGSFTPATFDSVTFAVSWERITVEDQAKMDAAQAKMDAAEAQAKAQAKKDEAEAARRKRLAAEQKKKDAELNTRIANDRAEEDAKAADERRKIRAACTVIYQNTIDKKVKDLTVREEQQVRACQVSGLYPPQ